MRSPLKTVSAVCSPEITLQKPSTAELTDINVSESWLKHKAVQDPKLGLRRRVGVPRVSHECIEMAPVVATASQSLEGLDATQSTGSMSSALDVQALDRVEWCRIEAFCIGGD